MDTQQQRETQQVHVIQNVSGDELKNQAWLQHRRRLIVWLHWKKEKARCGFSHYVILGACNPALAYKTLQQQINIGLLLPCNVIVYEADEAGKSVVAAIDAKLMLSVVGDNATVDAVATKLNEKLKRVVSY